MTTNIPTFDNTIEKTNRWLSNLQAAIGADERSQAYLAESALEPIVTAVFGLVAREVSAGEAEQVRALLPAEVRELWPKPGL